LFKGKVLEAAEKRKRDHYDKLISETSSRRCVFVPFAVDIHGGLGPAASKFLSVLSTFAKSQRSQLFSGKIIESLRCALACDLQYGNACIMFSGISKASSALPR